MAANEELAVPDPIPIASDETSEQDAGLEKPDDVIWDSEMEMCLSNPELIWQELFQTDCEPAPQAGTIKEEILIELPEQEAKQVTTSAETDSPVGDAATTKAIEVFSVAQASRSVPPAAPLGGPEIVELIATRGELRRVETYCADLEKQLRDLGDTLARRHSDFERYRFRMEREREETRQQVLSEIITQLLPVLDNLSRAVENSPHASASTLHFMQGIALIAQQLDNILADFGLQAIRSLGEQFDPGLHEAVSLELNPEIPPNTVTQELQRGYWLGDRLLRAAMVKVAGKV